MVTEGSDHPSLHGSADAEVEVQLLPAEAGAEEDPLLRLEAQYCSLGSQGQIETSH